MSVPTTSIGFSKSTPSAPDGYQIATPQSDDGTPQQLVDFAVPSTGGVAVKTTNYTLLASDCGKLIVANSASAITFTLPASIPFVQWEAKISNIGTGALSVVPGGSLALDGSASAVSVSQSQGIAIATDGSNYFSERGIWKTDSNLAISIVGLTIDGGGATPASGVKGFIQTPYAGTIIGWAMVADQAGSASIEIWKALSSAPPATPAVPTSTNKISASAAPSLTTAQSAASGTSGVSTWTTAVAQWDVFGFQLDSAFTVTRITLQIFIQRT